MCGFFNIFTDVLNASKGKLLRLLCTTVLGFFLNRQPPQKEISSGKVYCMPDGPFSHGLDFQLGLYYNVFIT